MENYLEYGMSMIGLVIPSDMSLVEIKKSVTNMADPYGTPFFFF